MTEILNEQQRQRAKEIMQEYMSASPGTDGKTVIEINKLEDENRIEIIENKLNPLVMSYLNGTTDLSDFKSEVDSINKRNPLWGFKGIKGQMFFNMVINVADDMDECNQELKSALTIPTNEEIASSRIKTFTSYVKRLNYFRMVLWLNCSSDSTLHNCSIFIIKRSILKWHAEFFLVSSTKETYGELIRFVIAG